MTGNTLESKEILHPAIKESTPHKQKENYGKIGSGQPMTAMNMEYKI
jgi:hypothetical protein